MYKNIAIALALSVSLHACSMSVNGEAEKIAEAELIAAVESAEASGIPEEIEIASKNLDKFYLAVAKERATKLIESPLGSAALGIVGPPYNGVFTALIIYLLPAIFKKPRRKVVNAAKGIAKAVSDITPWDGISDYKGAIKKLTGAVKDAVGVWTGGISDKAPEASIQHG